MAISSEMITSSATSEDVVQMMSSDATKDAALAIVQNAGAVLNDLVGIVITLIILAFLVYLYRWAVCGANQDERLQAIAGATRSAAALFLAVNIWVVIRALQAVFSFSYTTVYIGLFFFLFLLGFWSLFNLGDSFVRLLTRFADGVANILGGLGYGLFNSSQPISVVQRAVIRLVIVFLIGLSLIPFNWYA
ncbi:MAG: hypothetical protein AAB421_02750 [Patescibacteria group bacterium]